MANDKYVYGESQFKVLTSYGGKYETIETYEMLNAAIELGYPIRHGDIDITYSFSEKDRARAMVDDILEEHYLYEVWGEEDDLLIYGIEHDTLGTPSKRMLGLDKERQEIVIENMSGLFDMLLNTDPEVEEVPEEANEWHAGGYGEEDAVNHPSHYNQGMLETMEKFFLMFHDNDDMIKGALLFNVLKYTDRAGHKDNKEQDENKAKFYLNQLELLYPGDIEKFMFYRDAKTLKGN